MIMGIEWIISPKWIMFGAREMGGPGVRLVMYDSRAFLEQFSHSGGVRRILVIFASHNIDEPSVFIYWKNSLATIFTNEGKQASEEIMGNYDIIVVWPMGGSWRRKRFLWNQPLLVNWVAVVFISSHTMAISASGLSAVFDCCSSAIVIAMEMCFCYFARAVTV